MSSMKDMSIFFDVIRRYAQDDNTVDTKVDPNSLQVGQSVYDAEGKEMVVIGDPEGVDNKVLIPKDQVGQQYPAGAIPVSYNDLASSYNVQPAQGPQTANVIKSFKVLIEKGVGLGMGPGMGRKIKPGIGRGRGRGMGPGMGRGRNECPYDKSVMNEVEDWMTMGDDETNVGNWLDMDKESCDDSLNDKFKKKLFSIMPKFKRQSHDQKHYHDVLKAFASGLRAFNEVEDESDKFKSEFNGEDLDGFKIGEPGYTEVINCIDGLVNDGYETVDIILKIGEEFPREMGERVLSDARSQGIL